MYDVDVAVRDSCWTIDALSSSSVQALRTQSALIACIFGLCHLLSTYIGILHLVLVTDQPSLIFSPVYGSLCS